MKRIALAASIVAVAACSASQKQQKQQNGATPTKAAAKPRSGSPLSAIFAKPAFAQARQGKEVALADIAERAVRSVVNVRTTKTVRRPTSPFGPMYGAPPPRRRKAQGQGSGVIVDASGVVLTNNHVVAGASTIHVTLSDNKEFIAEVVGTDPKSDLAVLKIKDPPAGLTALPFGDSNTLRLGEVVLAIGNPFGVGQTVTMGIVSAKGRANVGIVDYEDFIQTDAAINPGNSGGALVNMRAQLIGINTAILSRSGGYQGIGFAIPAAMCKPIMTSLLKHGRVVRGWLGVVIQTLGKEMAPVLGVPVQAGVLVSDVQRGSPADKAGVRRGDVIVALDGAKMSSVARLRNTVAIKGINAKVKVTLYRKQKKLDLDVTLGELPGSGRAQLGSGQGALGGLTVETLTEQTRRRLGLPRRIGGVVVTRIERGSPAEAAGLRIGDAILEINRRPINSTGDFAANYRAAKDKLLMLVWRAGGAMYMLLEK